MRKLFVSVGAVGLLAAAACGPSRSDLTLNWTFNGGQTCTQAGVATIQVDIRGETLSPNQFACVNPNSTVNTGAYLGQYLHGNYDLTLTGLDGQGASLYQASSAVAVRGGGSVVSLDAARAVGSGGSATLRYSFAGKSCAAAGVNVVHMSVDGAVLVDASNNADLPCSQGGIDGVNVSPLSAGVHVIDVVGLVNGQVAYQQQGLSVTVVDGQDTAVTPNLPAATPTTGSAEINWSFVNGMTCAQAQVDSVRVFFDPNPDGTGGTDAGKVPCAASGVNGATFDGLAPGKHTVAITALRNATLGDTLVYVTRTPPIAELFLAGIITVLDVSADAASPGKGGTALVWQFPAGAPPCGSTTTRNIAYTLTDPSPAKVTMSGTATCGGTGGNSIDFCWKAPGAGTGCPGLAPGLWSITATTPGFAARNVAFGVPNNANASANVVFVAGP